METQRRAHKLNDIIENQNWRGLKSESAKFKHKKRNGGKKWMGKKGFYGFQLNIYKCD